MTLFDFIFRTKKYKRAASVAKLTEQEQIQLLVSLFEEFKEQQGGEEVLHEELSIETALYDGHVPYLPGTSITIRYRKWLGDQGYIALMDYPMMYTKHGLDVIGHKNEKFI